MNPDGSDAENIYRILEDEIIPLYYKTSESGVPQDWVKAMKAAMKSNAARFSARRMVKEYIEKGVNHNCCRNAEKFRKCGTI